MGIKVSTDHAPASSCPTTPTTAWSAKRERGGLDWGTGPVSLVLALLIAALVAYMSLVRDGRVSSDPQTEPAAD